MMAIGTCSGKMCTFQKVYIDIWGEVPAEVGDTVMRVDWDSGGICMLANSVNAPTFRRDANGLSFLFFDKNQVIGAPWYMEIKK